MIMQHRKSPSNALRRSTAAGAAPRQLKKKTIGGVRDLELRQIRTFVHVAELGSISAAAERLHVAQPALSRHLQALEQELGVRLFQRHGRGVSLTAAGNLLLSRSTGVLRELDGMRDDLRKAEDEPSGQVSFALPPTVAEVLCGPLVERFSCRFPQVRVSIATGYSGYVLDWLQRGVVDVAVLYDVVAAPTLRLQRLLTERLHLIRRPEDMAAASGGVAVETLFEQRLILPRAQHGLRRLLDAVAAEKGRELTPVIEVDSLPLQLDLVRRGFGATVLPAGAAYADIKAGRLVAQALVAPDVTRQLVLATPVDRPASRAARFFVEAIEETTRSLVESGMWGGAAPEPVQPAMPIGHS